MKAKKKNTHKKNRNKTATFVLFLAACNVSSLVQILFFPLCACHHSVSRRSKARLSTALLMEFRFEKNSPADRRSDRRTDRQTDRRSDRRSDRRTDRRTDCRHVTN